MRLKLFGVFALGTVGLLASTIAPGVTAAPDVFTTSTGYTQLATTGALNINPVPGSSFNATYTEWVFRDTNNVFCSTCLDFIIQYSNAGPGTSERLTTQGFDSFLTDVGYNTAGITGGPGATPMGVAPSTVDRSANGNVIGFNFIPPGSAINGGQASVLLQIQTNATAFTNGFVSIQDGVAGFGAGFQPASTVPEPKSTAFLIGACLLFGLMRWRVARQPKPAV